MRGVLCLLIILSFSNAFSQENDLDNIPVEYKKPVKIAGGDEDNVIFYDPWFMKYSKYDSCLYVSDLKNYSIWVLNTDLELVREIGRRGEGPVEFIEPHDIAFDKTGNIYVFDSGNSRIQVINRDNIWTSGFRIVAANAKKYLALDSRGRIYINTPQKNTIFSVFSEKGDLLEQFGKLYLYKNLMNQNMLNAVQFTIDEEDNLYCIFPAQAVLRKYKSSHSLEYEIDLSSLPEVKNLDKYIENRHGKIDFNSPNFLSRSKAFFGNISVDKAQLYINVIDLNRPNPIYVLDKKTGRILKKIILDVKNDENEFMKSDFFDCTSENYIFARFYRTAVIGKFKK